MTRIPLFDISGLSRREIVFVTVVSILFLTFQATVVGLIPGHILMVSLFLLMFFAHEYTRKLAVALVPFILFEISYDWMRLCPNYEVSPVDTRGLYETELSLFGIADGMRTVIPGEYFMNHHCLTADILAGLSYLCWVPVPIAFGVYLFIKNERSIYLRFALAFLFVNWLGFVGYYIHPAAPPWYILQHGFSVDFNTPGNVAGLIRFDEWLGLPVFQSIYVNNSNIFAAVPSLHAAYMFITTIYAAKSKHWSLTGLFSLITIGIWCTAVYSGHHYIIDVVLGILTAIVGIILFENVLMKWGPFKKAFQSYERYIS